MVESQSIAELVPTTSTKSLFIEVLVERAVMAEAIAFEGPKPIEWVLEQLKAGSLLELLVVG